MCIFMLYTCVYVYIHAYVYVYDIWVALVWHWVKLWRINWCASISVLEIAQSCFSMPLHSSNSPNPLGPVTACSAAPPHAVPTEIYMSLLLHIRHMTAKFFFLLPRSLFRTRGKYCELPIQHVSSLWTCFLQLPNSLWEFHLQIAQTKGLSLMSHRFFPSYNQ